MTEKWRNVKAEVEMPWLGHNKFEKQDQLFKQQGLLGGSVR